MARRDDIDSPWAFGVIIALGACVSGCGLGANSTSPGTQDDATSVSSTASGPTSTADSDSETDTTASTGETTGETADETADETTGPAAPLSYCADRTIGGYDRLQLWRRDETTDTCTLIRLIHFGSSWDGPTLEISDENFGVEQIVQQSGAQDCATSVSGSSALTAAGAIMMYGDPLQVIPDAVDVDATLGFDAAEPGIEPEVSFQIEGLVPGFGCNEADDWVPG